MEKIVLRHNQLKRSLQKKVDINVGKVKILWKESIVLLQLLYYDILSK